MSNASNLLLVFSCSTLLKHTKKAQKIFDTQKNIFWSGVCGGISDSHQTWKTALTVACFVPWCSMSHCLIWHSAATRLFGFVTLCGPSAPVPSIVLEFSIFGKKLGSFNWCTGLCFFHDFKKLSFNSSVIFLNHLLLLTCSDDDMIQHGRTMQHFSPGYLNVMLYLACY